MDLIKSGIFLILVNQWPLQFLFHWSMHKHLLYYLTQVVISLNIAEDLLSLHTPIQSLLGHLLSFHKDE